jgi:hypothetical protein
MIELLEDEFDPGFSISTLTLVLDENNIGKFIFRSNNFRYYNHLLCSEIYRKVVGLT